MTAEQHFHYSKAELRLPWRDHFFLDASSGEPYRYKFRQQCLNKAVSHAEWLRVTGPQKPRQPDQETT
jgi:hypothetical protein